MKKAQLTYGSSLSGNADVSSASFSSQLWSTTGRVESLCNKQTALKNAKFYLIIKTRVKQNDIMLFL